MLRSRRRPTRPTTGTCRSPRSRTTWRRPRRRGTERQAPLRAGQPGPDPAKPGGGRARRTTADAEVGRRPAAGRVRRARRRGETGTTLAFFLSTTDTCGEHGLFGKHKPYNEAVRIPFMTRWPGHPAQVATGEQDQRAVANIDIAPTVMSALGISPPAQSPPMDGRSVFDPAPGQAAARSVGEEPDAGVRRTAAAVRGAGVLPAVDGASHSAGPGSSRADAPDLGRPRWLEARTATTTTGTTCSTRRPTRRLENRTIFREFYREQRSVAARQPFGPDGSPGGGNDLGTPPLRTRSWAVSSRGTGSAGVIGPAGSWPPPCP